MRSTELFWLCLAAVAAPLAGQTSGAAVADSSPFRPLLLPAPTAQRNASGRPGRGYWQQRVDYRLSAALNSSTNTLHGSGAIHYQNNSPDTLTYLWFHVEQNICEPGSVTNVLNQPPLVFLGSAFDFSCQGFAGGGTLESLTSGGRELRRSRYGTTLRVELDTPLAPGAAVDLALAWRFGIPLSGAARMGRDGSLYQIAQWYPRLAVYDDVRGWNHEPYIGAGEFYLEYGSFDIALTVPASYLVAATGQLGNPETVLTPTQRTRLAAARRSDTTIAIVTKDEATDLGATRPTTAGTLTWHFTADSVRDFAFAAGPGMRWDASGYDGVLIETLYRPSAVAWEEANRMSREAIKHFSEQWFPYPYSHATSVEGPVEGMEYPMITFVPNSPTREDLHWVIAHELGHQWFPMLVGSNERLYPWMDEGFNTFIDLENVANYFEGTAYGDSIEAHPLNLYASHAVPGQEQPLISRPVEVRDLFWVGYQKPALMMRQLRDEVLGRERFDRAFREYIRAWAYKHPTPTDFFRVMRDASGMELDWFWRGWVFTSARLDQAVVGITNVDGRAAEVVVANLGTMVMPAELMLTFEDGSMTTVKLPVEMWNLGQRFTYRVPGGKSVRRAELDPRRALTDIDRTNNAWPR